MSESPSPERTSSLIVLALTTVTVGGYLAQLWAGVATALAGIMGALALTVSVWIVDSSPSPGKQFVVTLLSVPVAAGFAVGLVGTTVVLTGTLFPVETEMEVSVRILEIIGNLGIVLGSGLAIFGVTLGVTSTIAAEPIRLYTKTIFLTAVIPLSFGMLLVMVSIIERGSVESGTLLAQLWATAVRPSSSALHLSSFLFLVFVTASSLWLLVRRLPVEDLARSGSPARYRRVRRIASAPRIVAVVAILLTPPALLTDVLLRSAAIEAHVGETVFDFVQAVTLASWLRLVLVASATGTLLIVIVGVFLQQWSRYSRGGQATWLAPLAGGFVVTAVGVALADLAFEWTVTESTRHLPPGLAAAVLDRAQTAEQLYGLTSLVTLVIGGFILLAALIGLLLLASVYFGYLSKEGAGFSIAATGLFIGAIAAGLIGSPIWIVLGGVVVSLAVWDIGQFGTRLGHEIGDSAGRELVVIHTGVVAAVGLIAVSASVFVHAVFAPGTVTLTPTTTAALVSFVVGLIAFAVALR